MSIFKHTIADQYETDNRRVWASYTGYSPYLNETTYEIHLDDCHVQAKFKSGANIADVLDEKLIRIANGHYINIPTEYIELAAETIQASKA